MAAPAELELVAESGITLEELSRRHFGEALEALTYLHHHRSRRLILLGMVFETLRALSENFVGEEEVPRVAPFGRLSCPSETSRGQSSDLAASGVEPQKRITQAIIPQRAPQSQSATIE